MLTASPLQFIRRNACKFGKTASFYAALFSYWERHSRVPSVCVLMDNATSTLESQEPSVTAGTRPSETTLMFSASSGVLHHLNLQLNGEICPAVALGTLVYPSTRDSYPHNLKQSSPYNILKLRYSTSYCID